MNCKSHKKQKSWYTYKLLFVSHPDDDRYYKELCKDIFKLVNQCEIWYLEGNETKEDLKFVLKEVNFVVIPITDRLLCADHTDIDMLIQTIVCQHIPVLPIVVEPINNRIYREKFDNIQYLDKYSSEESGISYIDKLKKRLDFCVVGELYEKQIQNAFDAYVFLSYRKKDRVHADYLIRSLHEYDEIRNIAIYYDEFLKPGEDWKDGLKLAIDKSDMFTIIETSNMLNENNFVRKEEYPYAVEKNKRINLIRCEELDEEKIANIFPAAEENMSIKEWERIVSLYRDLLKNKACRISENDDILHRYFVALAYFYGISVEIDRQYAISTIEQILEEESDAPFDAYRQISDMYRFGNGTKRNIRRSVEFRKKYMEAIEKEKNIEQEMLLQEYISFKELMLEDENNNELSWREGKTDVHPAEWKPYDPLGAIEIEIKIIELLEKSFPDKKIELARECIWLSAFMKQNGLTYVLKYIYGEDCEQNNEIRKTLISDLNSKNIGFDGECSVNSAYWQKMLIYINKARVIYEELKEQNDVFQDYVNWAYMIETDIYTVLADVCNRTNNMVQENEFLYKAVENEITLVEIYKTSSEAAKYHDNVLDKMVEHCRKTINTLKMLCKRDSNLYYDKLKEFCLRCIKYADDLKSVKSENCNKQYIHELIVMGYNGIIKACENVNKQDYEKYMDKFAEYWKGMCL